MIENTLSTKMKILKIFTAIILLIIGLNSISYAAEAACSVCGEANWSNGYFYLNSQVHGTRKCKSCGHVDSTATVIAHQYGNWSNSGGTHSRSCVYCGYSQSHSASLSYSYEDENYHKSSCSGGCGLSSRSSHSWTQTSTTAATCTSAGSTTYKCYTCNGSKTDTTPALGHNYSSDWSSNSSGHWHQCTRCTSQSEYGAHTGGTATCTAKKVCSICKTSYGELDANNHNWGAWSSINETQHKRTCTRDNTHTQTANHIDNNNDGLCDDCRFEMKKIPNITVSPTTLNLIKGNSGTFTYTYDGDGDVKVTSSATGICTVASTDKNNKKITINSAGVGSSTITISFAETTKYKAGSITATVKVAEAYYKNNANVYYDTLANAFNGTATNGTITVLKNVTDASNATLAEGKTVTLNLDSKTLSVSNTIYNKGNLTINGNGQLIGKMQKSLALMNNTGTLLLSGTTLIQNSNEGDYPRVIQINAGTLTVENATLKVVTEGTANSAYMGSRVIVIGPGSATTINIKSGNIIADPTKQSALGIEAYSTGEKITSNINISGGTITALGWGIAFSGSGERAINVNITGGTITSTGVQAGIDTSNANINYTGTLTIGTKDQKVNKDSPIIEGGTYGVQTPKGFKFYDGTIKGKTAAFNGNVTEVESGYGVHYDTEGTLKTAYLVAANYEDNASPKNTYTTLAEAFSKTTGNTIKVLRDVTDNKAATVTENKTLTLDLNGKIITVNGLEYTVICNKGNLTIKDSSSNGKIERSTRVKIIENHSIFTMEGGTLESNYYPLHAYGTGKVTIKSGTINSIADTAIRIEEGDTELIIDGGTITGKTNGIEHKSNKNLTVNGGTITGINGRGIQSQKGGDLIINGGKIEGGTTAIIKSGGSTGDIIVNNGTIIGGPKANNGDGKGIHMNGTGSVTINGGNITGCNDAVCVVKTGKDLTITGGKIRVKYDPTYNTGIDETTGKDNDRAHQGDGVDFEGTGNVSISGVDTEIISEVQFGINFKGVGTCELQDVTVRSPKHAIRVGANEGQSVGNIIIKSGTYESTGESEDKHWALDTPEACVGARFDTTGKVIIGVKGGGVSTTSPSITGKGYGILSTNGFEFYDGILKGKTAAINGTVSAIEPDYGIHYDTEGDYKTAYLVVANYEDNANPKNTYAKLDDAFNKVASGRTITALKDLTEVGSNRIILEANKDITLNLNNKTITINNITSGAVMWGEIINKGNLTINGKGTITTSTENNNITTLISTENGTLTVDKDVTIEHKGIDFSTYYTLNFIGNYNANIYGKITVNTRETENEKISGATAINTTGSGTLNIIGATVLAQGTNDSKGYAIRIAGISDIEGTINIKDSNIKSSIGWAIDSYADPESSNKYKVNIENSTIEGTNYGINTDFIGEIEITVKDNAEIRSDNIALVINNNNSVKVCGGLIQGEKIGIENDSGSGAKGKIEIVSGTVKGGSNGITGWGPSTIIIGEPGGNVDITNPIIEGTDYGISTSDKNIEFYDGILKGKTAAYTVMPSKVETGYGVYDGEEGGYKVAYLKKIATIIPTPTEITLIYGDSEDIIYTCNGDGEITANIEDPNISEITLDTSAKKVGVKSHKVGETIVTISMAGTDEYLATSIEVPVTVIQKEITVIWIPELEEYVYTYNGQIQGPNIEKQLKGAYDETVNVELKERVKDAGSYTAEAYIVDITNGLIENYKLVNTTKAFVINRKDITVKADANQGKGPGEPEPDLTFTYEGNIEGEIPGFTGSLAREEGEGGGRYRIRRGTLELADTDTFNASNYNLIFIDEDTEFIISYDKEKELILVFKITDTNNKLILPIPENNLNEYTIIWGDKKSDMYTTEGFPEHIYDEAGTYTVEIGGIVKNFGYYNSLKPTESNLYSKYLNYVEQLIGIEALGDVDAERIGFAFCENLTGDIPEENLNLSDLVSAENMFNNCVLLQGPIPTNLLAGAEKVNSAKNMFLNCESLTGNIPSNLFADTKEITTFESTFNNCKNLDGTIPAELFTNGENVTTYAGTFKNCENLDGEIPAELFGKSTRVTTFKETFSNCTGLNTTISPKLFGTNPYVKNYYRTFYNCTGITGTIDRNTFSANMLIKEIPESDINSNFKQTFENCTGINKVELAAAIIGNEMFKGCTSIEEIDLEEVIDIGYNAFYGCNLLKVISADENTLRTIGIDAFEYTGTNPEKLLTKINRENETLLEYVWDDDNRLIDVEPPKGTLEIETPKDPFTKEELVDLIITVTDNYSSYDKCVMVIMNEKDYDEFANREYRDYDSLEWKPITAEVTEIKNWELTPGDDLKTVYVLFKDEFGNMNVVKDVLN